MTKIAVTCLLMLTAGFQYRLWVGEGSFSEVNVLKERAARQQTAIEILEYRNGILRAEIAELRTGLLSIEEKARSEFGMIKEGETFFLLVNDSLLQ